MCFSCTSPISAFVQLLLHQEHLARWHNQEHLGIGVFVLALSTVSQMLGKGVEKPAVARVCVLTDFPETNGFSFEPSKLMNVKSFGLCPLRWASMCSARELEGRVAAPLPLGGEQAEHTGV